jgi:tRNA threonylcarbamoyladenosine biosynthesis protein TsaB
VILIIESSADFPSVAICDLQGNVQFEKHADVFQSHSEQLPVLVKNALDWFTEQSLELLAIGVNQGPGSYTGLRIGVSLAKGLCYAKKIPLLAIDAFEAMGQYMFSKHSELKIVYAMIDARRDEVFMKRLEVPNSFAKVEAKILDNLITEENWQEVGFIGNSNDKAVRIIEKEPKVVLFGPFANQLCFEASKLFQNKQFQNVAYFEPFYLKDFVPGISKKFSV